MNAWTMLGAVAVSIVVWKLICPKKCETCKGSGRFAGVRCWACEGKGRRWS